MNKVETEIEKYLEQENTKAAKKILKDITNKSYFYFYKGEIKRIEGFMKEAVDCYEKVLNEKDRDDIVCFDSLLNLISLYRAEGNVGKTENLIKKAEKISPKDPRLKLEIAMFYRMKGEFKKALFELNKIKSGYLLSKDFQGVSYIEWAVGGIYRLMGEFKKAVDSYEKSVKYAEKSKDDSLKTYALLGLAGTFRVFGKIKNSYKCYSKAGKIIKSDDYFAKAYVCCGLANALRQMGEIKKAIFNYKKSYKLYKRIGDKLDLALVLWGMGECYKKLGEFETALEKFKKADNLFKKGFEPRGFILNRISTAQTLYLIGEKKKAKSIYFNALEEAKKHNLNTYLEIFT